MNDIFSERGKNMSEEKKVRTPRNPKMWEALVSLGALIVIMAVGIIHYGVDPHVPMFIGVIVAALMAMRLGYDWDSIETAMKDGIYRALQAVLILMIVGLLIGVWIIGGVVPAMIYYGMKLLAPSIFLVAAVLITSITSLATGTSWGTMGTMGLALIGIAIGLGVPEPIAAGAVISGSYFGDKMSPLSDTTNLAPAMAGTDVITHVKMMMLPTGVAYGITLIVFGILGFTTISNNAADESQIQAINHAMEANFNLNPLLLLPPVIVIVAVALKIPAIPGITLGIIAGVIMGLIFQPDAFGDYLDVGLNGVSREWIDDVTFVSSTGDETLILDRLLNSGGILGMMFSVSMTIIAMMFGGIMETTHQLEVIVDKLLKMVKGPAGLVVLTEATCVVSNATMPEQYISIVVPGRMYAETYQKMGLHPKTLSNALEGAGTVTSALIPWNTCGVYIHNTLGIATGQYFVWAFFNWLMPIINILFAFTGHSLANRDGKRCGNKAEKAKLMETVREFQAERNAQ